MHESIQDHLQGSGDVDLSMIKLVKYADLADEVGVHRSLHCCVYLQYDPREDNGGATNDLIDFCDSQQQKWQSLTKAVVCTVLL